MIAGQCGTGEFSDRNEQKSKNPDRTILTDAMWARIKDILPGKEGGPGVTAANSRLFMEAVLWRSRTGAPWRGLPKRFGNRKRVNKRFRRLAWSV